MEKGKTIKAKSSFVKFGKGCLIAVIICTIIFTGSYIADVCFSLEMEFPLWLVIALWGCVAWVGLLFYLLSFTKLFPRNITTFSETEMVIMDETGGRIKNRTTSVTTIQYKDILEIEYAKFSAIKLPREYFPREDIATEPE